MGELKVNCDAALFSREKSTHGLGWIARNHAGLCFAAVAIDPIVAEAMSMKEALSWVKSNWEEGGVVEEFCPTAVVMESNCLLLVNTINSKSQVLSPPSLIGLY
uniref:RNase H type-1 domain-containing protein n=1 Tax=Cannabis sativa TaxID=3483 RepID=A0A803PP01_CANSA